ncbi:MAG: hypothetical protein N3A69_15985, partial [Leptospiraceae bacterium]|nr:hypothetical protein [Leptospiraceae bacterium]
MRNLSIKGKIYITVGLFQVLFLGLATLGTLGLGRLNTNLNSFRAFFVNFSGNINNLNNAFELRKLYLEKAARTDNKENFSTFLELAKDQEKLIKPIFDDTKKFILSALSSSDFSESQRIELSNLSTLVDLIEKQLNSVIETTTYVQKQQEEFLKYDTPEYRKYQIPREISAHSQSKDMVYIELQKNLGQIYSSMSKNFSIGTEIAESIAKRLTMILWTGYFI